MWAQDVAAFAGVLVSRLFTAEAGFSYGIRDIEAVVRTGCIITSCGLIMAGTFVSMMTGSCRWR